MFYYISFLRPPPLHASPVHPIFITPQIANDLRTEPFPFSQDIFYSWSPCHPAPPTSPKKLTTYRPSQAYKPIPVPPPLGARRGESWCLALSATSSTHAVIELEIGEALGRMPFPVVSMPIVFSEGFGVAKGKARGVDNSQGKQERVERLYSLGLREGEAERMRMKIVEQTSFDLDKKVWDSGVGLSSWLLELAYAPEDNPITPLAALKDALFSTDPRDIIELGAGTGIVSLTLAAIRSSLHASSQAPSAGTILTTDLASALPLLSSNAAANTALFLSCPPHPHVLDWDEPLPPHLDERTLPFDAIIMADVTYNTASFPALLKTLRALLSFGQPRRTPVLLGYKQRHPAERALWALARDELGLEFVRVGERRGAGGEPVEVWLGSVGRERGNT